MFGPPVALLLSAVGLFVDESKGWATAGLVISGITLSLWLLPWLL